ncbi:hypothetical protein [Actinoplanes sp. ATCC 53533]|uniref:hypothetical protein n=1 Tax=Actinoplanes sp. ATCC 53533 TaxID=1288362 RepID=UPI000F7933A6|nr:hypothetical protein [Actinoplanes sp. ATCC 53533]
MMDHEWIQAPIGIDSRRWVSRVDCRTVLVVAHTMATCHRLLDVVELVECDPRVQVVFTVAPDVFNVGVKHHLRALGAVVLSWEQATRETFDVVIAASHGGLHELHGPLMVMAHGAGRAKIAIRPARGGPPLRTPTVYGLDAQRLARDGRILASKILLAHEKERDVLSRQCPEALGAAVVAGDVCFDRLVASLPLRERYRRALGIDDDQQLVVVSSTWGHHGLFGGDPGLLPQIMNQLSPRRFRVATLLHPAVWGAHGQRQIRAWTQDCQEAGMLLPDPCDDWRAVVAAADVLVGDYGSVTAYAAAIGLPILCRTMRGPEKVAPGSPQALAIDSAGRLDPSRSIRAQVRAARPVDFPRVAAAITSRPGRSRGLVRHALYQLLGLREPGRHRALAAVAVPQSTAAGDRS